MRYAVGSSLVRWHLAPGRHIGLFIGRQSQADYWTPILVRSVSSHDQEYHKRTTPELQPKVVRIRDSGRRIRNCRDFELYNLVTAWPKPSVTDEKNVVRIMAGLIVVLAQRWRRFGSTGSTHRVIDHPCIFMRRLLCR